MAVIAHSHGSVVPEEGNRSVMRRAVRTEDITTSSAVMLMKEKGYTPEEDNII